MKYWWIIFLSGCSANLVRIHVPRDVLVPTNATIPTPAPDAAPAAPAALVIHTTTCTGSATYTYSYSFTTTIELYDNGDKHISCGVSSPGPGGSASGETYVAASDTTANAAETCTLTYDIDTPSGGYWYSRYIGAVKYFTYVDTASPNNGTNVSVVCL